MFSADTASLGENDVLLAVPWPINFDSVKAVGSQLDRSKGLPSKTLEKVGSKAPISQEESPG